MPVRYISLNLRCGKLKGTRYAGNGNSAKCMFNNDGKLVGQSFSFDPRLDAKFANGPKPCPNTAYSLDEPSGTCIITTDACAGCPISFVHDGQTSTLKAVQQLEQDSVRTCA